MRYFTTDTHFGHPLVTVLRGFTTFDPTHSRYEEVLRTHDRKTAEDWAKEETFGAGLTFVRSPIRMRMTRRLWIISTLWSARMMSCGFWVISVSAHR